MIYLKFQIDALKWFLEQDWNENGYSYYRTKRKIKLFAKYLNVPYEDLVKRLKDE